MQRNLFSVEEVARKYQFRNDEILAAALKGTIPSVEKDGAIMLDEAAIGALVEQRDAAVYTADATAQILGVSAKTVRRYIKEGSLKATRVGGQWRIRAKDLQTFMSGPRQERAFAERERELLAYYRGDSSPIQSNVQGCMILNIKAENSAEVEDLCNQIIYTINNNHSGSIRFSYDWLEENKTARFILYDSPKALASFVFDNLERLNLLEASNRSTEE
jgi:excisionase family DNA binding protein